MISINITILIGQCAERSAADPYHVTLRPLNKATILIGLYAEHSKKMITFESTDLNGDLFIIKGLIIVSHGVLTHAGL